MKRIFLHLILFTIWPSISEAQHPDPIIDSLLLVLQNAPADTGKVKTYNVLALEYRTKGGPEKARTIVEESIRLSKKLDYTLGRAAAHNIYGLLEMDVGAYANSLAHQDSSLTLYKQAGNLRSMSNVLSNIGSVYWQQSKYTEALTYFHQALRTSQEAGAKGIQMIAYVNIGSVYGAQGNYPEATKNFLAALTLARELKNKYAIGVILSNIGVVYGYQKQHEEALKYHKECLTIMEEINNMEGMAMAYDQIGAIEERNDNHFVALEYFNKALNLYEDLGRKKQVAMIHNHIGSAYLGMNDFENAIKYFQLSLDERSALGDNEGVAESYGTLARTFIKQAELLAPTDARAKYLDAIHHIEQSLHLNQEVGYSEGIKGSYKELSKVYHALGEYQKAFEYQEKFIALQDSLLNNETTRQLDQLRTQYEVEKAVAEEKAEKDSLLAVHKFQSEKELAERNAKHRVEIAEAKAQEEKAIEAARYRYLLQLAEAQNEQEKQLAEQQYQNELRIAEERARHQIALAEEKARQEEKEAKAEATRLREKQERERRTEMALSVGGLAVLLTIFFLMYQQQRNLKQKAIERADTIHKLTELELQSLRAQLNPHFMFNSLNAIQELILLEENDKSHTYLARFAKLLRMLLENANNPLVPLARELEFLQLYLSLEKLRIPDLDYYMHIAPDIKTEHTRIPNMILQPYIENAIWHGLSPKRGEKKLTISIARHNGSIQYEIEDNGVGREKAAELKSQYRKEHKSRGMELLTKRFKLLSKEYGSEITTTITDVLQDEKIGGTKVIITVPVSIFEKAAFATN